MTPDQWNLILPLAISVIGGVLIPFITNLVNRYLAMSPAIQSFLYLALSALTAVLPTITFDKDLKGYLMALGIAWLTSMRMHYTTIPNAVIPPYKPKHALDPDRLSS